MSENKTVLKPGKSSKRWSMFGPVLCFVLGLLFLFVFCKGSLRSKSWIDFIVPGYCFLASAVLFVHESIKTHNSYIEFDDSCITISSGYSKRTVRREDITDCLVENDKLALYYKNVNGKIEKFRFEQFFSSEDLKKLNDWLPQKIHNKEVEQQVARFNAEAEEMNRKQIPGQTDVEKQDEIKKYFKIASVVNFFGLISPLIYVLFQGFYDLLRHCNIAAPCRLIDALSMFFLYLSVVLLFLIPVVPLVFKDHIKIKISRSAYPNVFLGFIMDGVVLCFILFHYLYSIIDLKLCCIEVAAGTVILFVVFYFLLWRNEDIVCNSIKNIIFVITLNILLGGMYSCIFVAFVNCVMPGKVLSQTSAVVQYKDKVPVRNGKNYYLHLKTENQPGKNYEVGFFQYYKTKDNDHVVIFEKEGLLKIKYFDIKKIEEEK